MAVHDSFSHATRRISRRNTLGIRTLDGKFSEQRVCDYGGKDHGKSARRFSNASLKAETKDLFIRNHGVLHLDIPLALLKPEVETDDGNPSGMQIQEHQLDDRFQNLLFDVREIPK